MMQEIPLSNARPGMKLAVPLTRKDGLVIVAEGTELTESLLSRLENMGIGRLLVAGTPEDASAQMDGPASARVRRLDHLFRAHSEDRWMTGVKEALRRYFERKAAAAAKSGDE